MPVAIKVESDLTGIRSFDQFKTDFPKNVKFAVKQIVNDYRTIVQEETPWDTGHAKESWSPVMEEGSSFSFENPVGYIPDLEWGLYPKVGKPVPPRNIPRTVKTSDGIYSRQAVGGWIRKYVQSEEALERLTSAIIAQFYKSG